MQPVSGVMLVFRCEVDNTISSVGIKLPVAGVVAVDKSLPNTWDFGGNLGEHI